MTAAITAAVIGAGAVVYGANKSASASKSAANAQVQASQNANQTQLAMYNQNREDQTPWRTGGGQAVNALSQFFGQGGTSVDPGTGQVLTGSGGVQQQIPGGGTSAPPDYNKILSGLPGYQFQMDQGQKAVEHNLSARGLLDSGAAGKALTQYGQGVANNYAQQYVGGLESLAGLGQSSVQSTGAAGANAANQVGANQIYAGNAQASGYVGQANAVNAGLSGLAGIYGQYQAGANARYNSTYDSLQPITPSTGYLPPQSSPGTTTYYGGP